MARIPGFSDRTRDNIELTDAAAQTYTVGALLVLNGSQNTTECGANPAAIYGMACGNATKHPQGALLTTVAKLWNAQKVWMPFTTATPLRSANESKNYGVVKNADGVWAINDADTVNTRVFVHYVDEVRAMGLVSVLTANRQIAP